MSASAENAIPLCERCGNPIDDCKCVCPYCGKSIECECCIGSNAVTGG